MIHEKSIKKIVKTLWSDPEKGPTLSEKEQEIKTRYMAMFHLMLEDPSKKDVEFANFLMNEYGISRAQAYYDISNVKVLFGNIQKSSKDYDRYVVTEALKEAVNKARDAFDTAAEDRKAYHLKNLIYALDKLGKYTRLDQDDGDKIPWDEIVPMDIEPTGDVSVLGMKPIPNLKEKQKQLRDKYGKVEDAKIVINGE